MKPSTSYEFRRTLSSSSLEAARCAGVGVATLSLMVLNCQLPVVGRGHRPPKMDTWRTRVLSARRGWGNGGWGRWQPMGRNDQGRRRPYEARRTGALAAP